MRITAEWGGVPEELGIEVAGVRSVANRLHDPSEKWTEFTIKDDIWKLVSEPVLKALNEEELGEEEFPTWMFYEFTSMWKLGYEVLRNSQHEAALPYVLMLLGFRQAKTLTGWNEQHWINMMNPVRCVHEINLGVAERVEAGAVGVAQATV